MTENKVNTSTYILHDRVEQELNAHQEPLSASMASIGNLGDFFGTPFVSPLISSLPAQFLKYQNFKLKIINEKILKHGIPEYATPGSASADLRAAIDEPYILKAGERHTFPTGIAIFINDPNFAAFVDSRSGLAHKHGVHVLNARGTIDSDYQNEIGVILHNSGTQDYEVQPFERIAQLNIQPVIRAKWDIVTDFNVETDRGLGGFGSSGKL